MTTRRFNRDRVLRQLARRHPESLVPVLREIHLVPREVEAVDLQSVERERYPDAVLKVTDERGRVHHVHVEFEAKADGGLPWRLAVTHVLLSTHRAVGGSRERPAPRLRTVVVALHDGPLPDGDYRVEERLAFRFEVVRLQAIPAEVLARSPETAALAPLGRDPDREVLRRAITALASVEDPALKADLQDAFVRLTRAHLGRTMERVARTIMAEANIAVSDLLIYQEGRQEGLQEGREEGRQEGRLEGLREGLRKMWLLRFGRPGLDAFTELVETLDGEAMERVSDDLLVTRARDGRRYAATLRRRHAAR